MIMNLNSQMSLVEPFFHGVGLNELTINHNHNFENMATALFPSNEHESPLINLDLTLTPPSSNNAITPNLSSNSFVGAISNSILNTHSLQQEPLSQFFGQSPEMLSSPIKSGTSSSQAHLTTFDLDRNAFLTNTPGPQSIEFDSQTLSSFHADQNVTSLHHLQPSHRNMKLRNSSSNEDFHDERICFGCRTSLNTSRFILSVSGYHNWHTDCLCCSECGQSLCSSSTCYIHNGRMYCRADYQRLNECSKCHQTIDQSDWVRRAGDRLYHLACFICDVCQRQLSTGENFTVMRHSKNDTRLLCKLHFSIRGQDSNEDRQLSSELGVQTPSPQLSLNGETNISQAASLSKANPNLPGALLVSATASTVSQSTTNSTSHNTVNINGQISAGSHSSSSSQQSGPTSVSSSSGTSAGGSKTKRVRTTFTEDQLNILQANFQSDSNPDGQDLERIAALTGLSKRVTQVWFQNSRARQKKYLSKSARSVNGQSPNLMLSLRPGTGASGTSSGLWSPASSTGSADTTPQSQLALSLQSQQSILSTQISLPIHGSNLKWRTNEMCSTGHITNLNGNDEDSLDVSPSQRSTTTIDHHNH